MKQDVTRTSPCGEWWLLLPGWVFSLLSTVPLTLLFSFRLLPFAHSTLSCHSRENDKRTVVGFVCVLVVFCGCLVYPKEALPHLHTDGKQDWIHCLTFLFTINIQSPIEKWHWPLLICCGAGNEKVSWIWTDVIWSLLAALMHLF